MNVAVVGTGYVGLVTGAVFADLGNDVVCVDKDAAKIEGLRAGQMPIYEPGLEELVARNVADGRLAFTTDLTDAVRRSDIVFIAVGTPPKASGESDLTAVEEVALGIAQALDRYKVIVNKSTVPVGTGDLVRNIIERNRRRPVNFDVVSNPEFLREGSAIEDTLRPDRIVVGAPNQQVAMTLLELYAPLERPMIITDVHSAEIIKYASNAFLATKISFINEIANLCELAGGDVTQVVKGMGLDPRIGAAFLNAGLGYGGSCFPKDTDSLIQTAAARGYDFRLLRAVVEVNRERVAALRGDDPQDPRPAGGPRGRGARAGLQAQDRRHARGAERRGGPAPPGGRRPGAGLRSGRHGERQAHPPAGRRVLPVLLRCRRRGGRGGDRDRVERVQAAEPRAAPRAHAAAPDLRRPQHLRAGADAPAGIRVPLDRPAAGLPCLRVPMRVLVTGGAGFIGSHLCEFLLGQGGEVVCLDNLLTGTTDNIDHLRSSRFTFIKHDVTTYIYVAGPLDYVLHFASPASPVDYQQLPIPTLKVGALGTHKALGLAKAKRARFLLASTSEVYGDPLIHPQREDYWGNVNPVGPRGVYDEAKRFAEAMTMAYHRYHGLDTRIVRIFNTFGERMRMNDGRAIPNFLRQALTRRAHHHLRRRLPDALVLLRLGPRRRHLAADAGSGPRSGQPRQPARDDAARPGQADPPPDREPERLVFQPLPHDDPRVRQPDITRARTLLGWEPRVDVDEGLRKTIEWFRRPSARPDGPPPSGGTR